MKEIKFRAWHKPTETMQTVASIDFNNSAIDTYGHSKPELAGGGEPIYNIPLSHVELMQFTGEADKNCAEIWEGDVLFNPDRSQHSKVIFMDGCYWCEYSCDNRVLLIDSLGNLNYKVGNIYENPDLLKD